MTDGERPTSAAERPPTADIEVPPERVALNARMVVLAFLGALLPAGLVLLGLRFALGVADPVWSIGIAAAVGLLSWSIQLDAERARPRERFNAEQAEKIRAAETAISMEHYDDQTLAGIASPERERLASLIAEKEEERIRRRQAELERRRQLRFIQHLQSMDPFEFERLIAEMYRKLGYQARVTPKTNDGGVDIEIWKDGRKQLVQCKRVQTSVGRPDVQQLFGVLEGDPEAKAAIMVTTGKISAQAWEWARGKRIEFVMGNRLLGKLAEAFPEMDPTG